MKKSLFAFVMMATLAAAFLFTGTVFAQSVPPLTPAAPRTGYGYAGGMRAQGMYSARNGKAAIGDGILHDAMIAVYAEELGIPAADLEARLAAGETFAQVAFAQGLTVEQFQALKTEARVQAVDQAVQAGTLTQEQADWMKQSGSGMNGSKGRGQGMRGANADSVNCLAFSEVTP